jgi:hypothetical protein
MRIIVKEKIVSTLVIAHNVLGSPSRRVGLGCAPMVRPASPIMPRRRGVPKPDRRRALELLAASPDGCTEAIMLAHGFTVELLVDLCIAELAIATTERMVAGGRTVEVVRMRITEAGRSVVSARPLGGLSN